MDKLKTLYSDIISKKWLYWMSFFVTFNFEICRNFYFSIFEICRNFCFSISVFILKIINILFLRLVDIRLFLIPTMNTTDNSDLSVATSFFSNLLPILVAIISILYLYFSYFSIRNTEILKTTLIDIENRCNDMLLYNRKIITLKELSSKYSDLEQRSLFSYLIEFFETYRRTYEKYQAMDLVLTKIQTLIKISMVFFLIIFLLLTVLLPINFLLSITLFLCFSYLSHRLTKLSLYFTNSSTLKFYPSPDNLLDPAYIIPPDIVKNINISHDLPLLIFTTLTFVVIEPYDDKRFNLQDAKYVPDKSKISHFVIIKSAFDFKIDKIYLEAQLLGPKSELLFRQNFLATKNHSNKNLYINNEITLLPCCNLDNIYHSIEENRKEQIIPNSPYSDSNFIFVLYFNNPSISINYVYNHNNSSENYFSFSPYWSGRALKNEQPNESFVFLEGIADCNILISK